MAEATEQGSLGGASSRADSDELRVFEGLRPTRTGDLVLEGQGMAPIPDFHVPFWLERCAARSGSPSSATAGPRSSHSAWRSGSWSHS